MHHPPVRTPTLSILLAAALTAAAALPAPPAGATDCRMRDLPAGTQGRPTPGLIAGRVDLPAPDKGRHERFTDGTYTLLRSDRIFSDTAFDAKGFPLSLPDPAELRAWLQAGRYDELDALLQRFQAAAERDFRKERWIDTALDAFRNGAAGTSLGTALDGWVRAKPQSALAYAARGLNSYEKAWDARGSASAVDTGSAKWAAMYAMFDTAQRDLDRAHELNPKVMRVYATRLGMAMAEGGTKYGTVEQHYTDGLGVNPHSFDLRYRYVLAMRPRWGGTYGQMSAAARAGQQYVSQNPRLETLYGVVLDDLASLSTDQPQEQITLMTQALAYGELPDFYYRRAMAYERLGQWDEAGADWQRVVDLDPLAAHSRRMVAVHHARAGHKQAARAHLKWLMYLFPGHRETEQARQDVANAEALRDGLLPAASGE